MVLLDLRGEFGGFTRFGGVILVVLLDLGDDLGGSAGFEAWFWKFW